MINLLYKYLMLHNNKKAQGIVEYALILAFVVIIAAGLVSYTIVVYPDGTYDLRSLAQSVIDVFYRVGKIFKNNL